MSENKSLSKGGAYYLIYNVLNMAFPFLTGLYVARTLLPSNIGDVVAAQNLATYFCILAFLGIPTYGLREIAKTRNCREERNKVFSELYVINLISTVFFTTVYFILIGFIPIYRQNFLLYAIVGLSIALNSFNISWLYEGLEEFRFISLRNIAFKSLSFICLIFFVRTPNDYLAYAAITVVGTAGNNIVNMLYYSKFATLSFRKLNLRRHLKSIFYLVMVNLAIEIYSLMDITMMNFMCHKENIAYYKYGVAANNILLQVVNTFTMVLVPRISYYYKQNMMGDFNNLVSKGMRLIILTSVPMIVGIFFTSDFLVQQMYGFQYVNSAIVLKMCSLLLLISPIGYLLGSRMLLVSGHEDKMVICVGLGALVNLIGNVLLIPRMQEVGAAIASIVSGLIVMIVYVGYGRNYFRLVNVSKSAVKVVVSAFLMGVFLFACTKIDVNGWIKVSIQIFGAVFIYVFLLIVGKEDTTNQYIGILLSKIKCKK